MNVRAVIFDIYKTLLTVSPPPADAGARWTALCARMLPDAEQLPLEDFGARCKAVIERDHAAARWRGIAFPEVFWPHVAREAFPALAALSWKQLDEFLLAQVALWHTVGLAPGAGGILKRFAAAGVPLGIVSNCQPYTLHELDRCLAETDLTRGVFDASLCFLSYLAGFSKPDPHVFRWLTARLAALGIAPGETLDNDIAPARQQGFLTWQITPQPTTDGGPAGDWTQFAAKVRDLP
jgi:FMN phosphatase YigB (HAD superfamily)